MEMRAWSFSFFLCEGRPLEVLSKEIKNKMVIRVGRCTVLFIMFSSLRYQEPIPDQA